jgi:hypothetical protein
MTSFEWQVPLIVIVIIVALLYLTGRTKREADIRPAEPTSGPELIERLQQTLGIAVVVESIEAAPDEPVEQGGTVTIRATFIFGSHTRDVTVTDESEAKAWEALAIAAIAWRNSDYQHVRIWGSGG